jgi:hypothetical protein
MSAISNLETSLAKLYKGAPKLPKNGQKGLVKYLPWISLVIGILSLYSAWALWHWAHVANALVNYANTINQLYGGSTVTVQRMSVGIWLAFFVMLVEAILLLVAVSGLRTQKKSSWNLLFYISLINILYGFILIFTDYGSISSFIFSLIGSAIGLYFLFQIREYYKSTPEKSPKK